MYYMIYMLYKGDQRPGPGGDLAGAHGGGGVDLLGGPQEGGGVHGEGDRALEEGLREAQETSRVIKHDSEIHI